MAEIGTVIGGVDIGSSLRTENLRPGEEHPPARPSDVFLKAGRPLAADSLRVPCTARPKLKTTSRRGFDPVWRSTEAMAERPSPASKFPPDARPFPLPEQGDGVRGERRSYALVQRLLLRPSRRRR